MPIWLKLTGAVMVILVQGLSCLAEDGLQSGGDLAPPHVDADGEHDDRADDDILRRGRHGVQVERVLDDDDRHRADDGVDDVAAPAGEAGAADHGRGDRRKLQADAVVRRAGIEPRRHQDGADRGRQRRR